MRVAALFVDADGCYAGVRAVDVWDQERDARKYDGPWPVVAHPPCQRWSRLAMCNYIKFGRPRHLRPGNDSGCFASALSHVERCGGVLEHPASTAAWPKFGLHRPVRGAWTQSRRGWVCEVWQSAYGHPANKATWLYYVGHKRPFCLRWDRPEGAYKVGYRALSDNRPESQRRPTLPRWLREATPPAFRDVLLRLARQSQRT